MAKKKTEAPEDLPREDLNRLYRFVRDEYPHHFRLDSGKPDKSALKAFIRKEVGAALDTAAANGKLYANHYRYCRNWIRRSLGYMGWEPKPAKERAPYGRGLAGDGIEELPSLLKRMLH